jgi:hypothetical protein
MNIGLIDVDSHNFPNLALMKISAFHKIKGDQVEWWNGFKHYDIVYKSRIFTDQYSTDVDYCINADEIIKGGTGYDLQNVLPYEIEHQYPDYGLYNITERAYGFLTRGCPRHCPFCIVSEKEGNTHTVADLSEFWNCQPEIMVMDSNITASKDCERLFEQLIASKAKINFEGGVDIRFMTEKKCDQLNRMNISMLHFAWDNYEFETYEKFKRFRPLIDLDERRLCAYVLTNFNTNHAQDLERIYKLKELGITPYVMIYDKHTAPQKTRLLQRWCNNRFIFRAVERFEDYDKRKG